MDHTGTLDFDGDTYKPRLDGLRLGSQLYMVLTIVHDHEWHTIDELVGRCGGTHASISARLRDMRKPKFGGHVVLSRRKGGPERGVWEYRLEKDYRATTLARLHETQRH